MAPKRQPTNADLLKQLELNKLEVHSALAKQNKRLEASIGDIGKNVMQVQTDVNELKRWQGDVLAVEKYKSGDLLKYIGIVLTILGLIVAAAKVMK